jgi:putative transposase
VKRLPTLTIKLPLFKPTKAKESMYRCMQEGFSKACNQVLEIKKENSKVKVTEIDQALKPIGLPSTLVQEARKLALSRYQDWKANKETKGFPSFRKHISILFNN